ncbi:hypothetical protein FHS00_001287 [Limimaricola variabilis]|jgi:hypothetical protein|uniref:YdhG-like domain-containing protein n=1 Tax=Limimaricola variabilis TaxID=1492771 RepID=A0ABR6HMT5_9RHOB|nr:DUF1801 domain-containing protein [Limimaricola variabilis]MBB3711716.1 hypothetical protein [Limimaricola variabilis]WPY94448.1 DUF1801 domain-containing protein [Limimaricola variabilis]
MTGNKTQPTGESVEAFLAAVEPERRREDAQALDALFREVTGFVPQMWGPSILGYGSYDYVYDSGRSGRFLATGFSPRKANLVLYIMPGYDEANPILARLGKYRTGKSCLYINRLADVDRGVLAELIRHGLDRLETFWPVHPI